MNGSLLVNPLSIVFVTFMMFLAGGSVLSSGKPTRFDQWVSLITDQSPGGEAAQEAICSDSNEILLNCEKMEEMILSTSLRIEIKTGIIYVEDQGYSSLSSNGYGTVMDGRYLLTHNHFQLPLLELLADDFNGQFAKITLYTASGSLLWQGPLTTAGVAFADSETLLLEFLARDGQGLFESLGIPSADFTADITQHITVGATVAQVNWDNERAYIQWAKVEDVFIEDDTPILQLTGCIIGGSSGGGVFLNGEHIANNWSRSRGCGAGSDDASSLYSKAAINSAKLIAAGLPPNQGQE